MWMTNPIQYFENNRGGLLPYQTDSGSGFTGTSRRIRIPEYRDDRISCLEFICEADETRS